MQVVPVKWRRVLLTLAPALALPAAAAAQCPPAGDVQKTLQQVFKRPIDVKEVLASPLKGLCEVQVSFQGRANILYVDAGGAWFVTGHLIDAKSGKDVTEETLAALNTIGAEEMQKLAGLAAFQLGTKGKVVYFATDPM